MPPDEPIKLSGELTLEDVRRGRRLAESSFWTNLYRTLLILFNLLCVVVLIGEVIPSRPYPQATAEGIVTTISALVPVLSLWRYIWNRNCDRRAWEKSEGMFCKADTTVSAQGVCINNPYAQAEFQWTHFKGFRQSEGIVILYGSAGWLLLARSRFGCDADWMHFVSLVETHVKQRV